MSARCNWCIGMIRRDCHIMERCVQTGIRRPNRVTLARIDAAEAAKTPQSGLAEGESR